jgi:flap endonuclease-1
MGVNLRDLFPQHPVPVGWFHGKRIAVDGHNVAFRYLAAMRGPDGDVKRVDGRPVGHLLGFVNLVGYLRENGATPIVVWDGATHPLKRDTVEGRITARVEAALNAEDALTAGDRVAYLKHLRASTYIDAGMVRDAKLLLQALGVSMVDAPNDGERYAAALCLAGYADAVATEDYDALVAGAPFVVRKAGGRDCSLHDLGDLARHGLTREQLRHVAILCGTDFHPGVKGFGAKTAVRMLAEHADVRRLIAEAAQGVETTRYHQLLAEAGRLPDFKEGRLTLADFDRVDEFLADLPLPSAPPAQRDDIVLARRLERKWDLPKHRVTACFC